MAPCEWCYLRGAMYVAPCERETWTGYWKPSFRTFVERAFSFVSRMLWCKSKPNKKLRNSLSTCCTFCERGGDHQSILAVHAGALSTLCQCCNATWLSTFLASWKAKIVVPVQPYVLWFAVLLTSLYNTAAKAELSHLLQISNFHPCHAVRASLA